MIKLGYLAAAAALAAVVAGHAWASSRQSAAPGAAEPGAGRTASIRAACRDDVKRLCGTAERGEARRTCMQANRDKLSPACTAAREARRTEGRQRRQAFRGACGEDIKRVCADAGRGRRAAFQCLNGNADKISAACKTEIAAMPAPRDRADRQRRE
jgi:hypothetical protein